LQCAWLISRTLRTNGGTNIGELERIHEGLQQWRGRGIAGTIDSEFRRQVSLEFPKDEYDRDRSPLWYLVASAPLVAWSGTLGPETVHSWGWLARAPYIVFGLLLGASLWYVARRLFGNVGGYIALALYCFSPAMIITTSAGLFVDPEMGAVWASFERCLRPSPLRTPYMRREKWSYGTGGEFFCYRFHWFLRWSQSSSSFFCR
jgi:hypothetical protein